MPWSASTLFAPAHSELKNAWMEHPALGPGLHLFPQLPHCQLPAVGLLAVPEVITPENCECESQIPWDALLPGRPLQATPHQPPAHLLAYLSQISRIAPLLFYRGETHGGEMLHEESWIFHDGKIERYRKDPLVSGMAAIGVTLPAGGWFEPFTSSFDWRLYRIGPRPVRPTPGSLYQAAQAGNWSHVEALLLKGCPLANYREPSPMAWALRQDNLTAMRLLLAHGHRLSAWDLGQCRSAEAVSLLRAAGVRPDERSPLTMLENGALEAWQELGQQHEWGETFLAACYGGVTSVAESALQHDPGLIERVRFGDRPLTMAARNGNQKLCDLLLARGAEWDESALFEAAGQGHVELVRQALAAGVSPQARRWGRSALSHAAGHNQVQVLEVLSHTDLGHPDQYGGTALQAAALAGAREALEWLLQRGVPLETRDDGGCTALWSAVGGGRQAIVDLLLEAGADPTVVNDYGDALSTLASQRQIQLPARQNTTANNPLQSDHQA